MKPTISIITVTFNAANVLPGLIESLRAQSDQDFEWIVVDGASMDGTVNIIQSASDVVSKWVSEPDFGIYHAMNKAIDRATGEYYLVMGADDRLECDAIERYRYFAQQSNADIITAYITRKGKIYKGKPKYTWLYAMNALIVNHSVGALIRRSLHEEFGLYSKRFPIGADMYFIKLACQSSSTKIFRADFIAGNYSEVGISSTDKAAAFCDYFRVQLETEKFKLLQVIMFSAKLLWRAKDLVKETDKKTS